MVTYRETARHARLIRVNYGARIAEVVFKLIRKSIAEKRDSESLLFLLPRITPFSPFILYTTVHRHGFLLGLYLDRSYREEDCIMVESSRERHAEGTSAGTS